MNSRQEAPPESFRQGGTGSVLTIRDKYPAWPIQALVRAERLARLIKTTPPASAPEPVKVQERAEAARHGVPSTKGMAA